MKELIYLMESKMKVVIAGATGFLGQVVVRQLLAAGDEVVVLTRNVAKAALTLGRSCQFYQWDNYEILPPVEAFDGADGVINLLGESISKKWDESYKKKLLDSRIQSTRNLIAAMETSATKPKVYVSASAIGIYGDRGNEEISEGSETKSDGFLAKLCLEWEAEANKAKARVVTIRTGIVIGRNGGALTKMLPVFKMGLGGKLGSGNQYMSWIHVEDAAGIFIEALKNDTMSGPVNATAPYPARNAEFTKVMGKVLKRPTIFPTPAFALNLVFGEMSQVLLEGQKVFPTKVKKTNFRFRYPTLEMALKETAY